MNTDLPTFSQTTLLPSIGPVGGEPLIAAKSQVAKAEREIRFQSLGIILERLWMFYEAMRSGKPIGNSDEMLAEVRGALMKARRPTPAHTAVFDAGGSQGRAVGVLELVRDIANSQ
jgi:hypothetical protein